MNLEQPGESPDFTSRGNWITKSVAGNNILEANSPPWWVKDALWDLAHLPGESPPCTPLQHHGV